MTGSGMQQARDLRAEETIEVVRNHEDGTGRQGRDSLPPKPTATSVGVDARQGRWRGGKAAERSVRPTRIERLQAPKGSQDLRVRTALRLRKKYGTGVTPSEDLEDPRGNA